MGRAFLFYNIHLYIFISLCKENVNSLDKQLFVNGLGTLFVLLGY